MDNSGAVHLTHHPDGRMVADFAGEICSENAFDIRESIKPHVDKGFVRILFNLTDVSYMDSAGLAMLVNIVKSVSPKGGRVSICGCNSVVDRVMRLTHMDSIAKIYEKFDDAFDSLRAPSI